jgi:hypothetical protein
METPLFWRVMQYTCDRCGHRMEFYLEDGCEGPRDRQVPIPPQWERMRQRAPASVRARLPTTVPQSASGRYILPVPFVAGACRKCQPGGPPYSLQGGVMQHSNWSADRDEYRERPPTDAGRFLYPSDWWADQACGHPVFPPTTPED